MKALFYLARRFVAGERREEAVKAVHVLNKESLLASLDVLGEEVSDKKEAESAAQEYLLLLDDIFRSGAQSNVSVKLTQLGLDLGEEYCLSLMQKILTKAQERKNFVRIDMEGSAYTKRTLNIFRTLYKEFSNVGIVIQSYLHRSERDAQELALIQAPVRVCKGAYKEPASIAYKSMNDIRKNFKNLVEILLKNKSQVAIATHDEELIQWALKWTQEEKIPKEQFEFQLLYGLRRKRARELASMGYNVRTYVPYGTHWLPYFSRRLRERKENVFFVLKSLIKD